MRPPFEPRRLSAAIGLAFLGTLVACGGGGGGDDTPAPAPVTRLSGTAATGAPLAGASVSVVDSDAATPDPAPVTSAADGSYTVDVTALKPPLVVKAVGQADGAPTTLLSVVPSVEADVVNTANVTPLTHAVAALVAPGGDPSALLAPAALASHATPAKVSSATSLVVNTLATDPAIASALGSTFHPQTTPFKADGTGIDGVLDKLEVSVAPAGVSIVNLAALQTAAAVPTPVLLTAAQTATPNVVPTLQASAAASDLPTAAELAALGAKVQTCLALPVAQRVGLDAAGNVTSVSAACDYAPAGWRSNGRNWAQEVGQFTLAKNLFTGAKVGKGVVVLALAPENLTGAKEFKHPYCNTASCVVVRWPLTTASNQSSASDWVLGKVDGAWNFVGNQRPYRAFVDPRLNRKINTNRDGAAAGNTANPYFFKDRFESALRLTFDLSVADTANVRAVRFSGPGLPAAGVVLLRSQRCATDDRMAIVSQSGSTRVPGQTGFGFFSGGSAAEFVLDAANLDGTPLAMPAPVANSTAFQDFSPTPVANQGTAIPAWTRYKIEVFRFNALSDEPDEIFYTRVGAAAENAALGVGKPWPTLAPSFIDAYLKPGGASAGTVSSLAHTMSWTAAPGTYVGSSYLFGQNFLTMLNGENESANFARRGRLDFEPAALGDSTATAFDYASVASGTSLSSYTATVGTNPNPRCTSQDLVPLTTNTNDYRDAGLSFRGTDRKLYQSIWFWEN